MRLGPYFAKRVLLLIPQVFVIVTLTFVLVRLLPGDPAATAAGPLATPERVQQLTKDFGLDRSIFDQWVIYIGNVLHGDLGVSWYTSSDVMDDLRARFPATLELITISMICALVVGVGGGIILALRPGGWGDRASFGYGLFAGSLPEFWWALMLVFVFFVKLHWFPAPLGRLPIGEEPPPNITGMYVFDSLVTGSWSTLRASLAQLALPVITLTFVTCGAILKMTRENMIRALQSEWVRYARALGVPRTVIARRALRAALPPVANLVGIIYGYLIGGAVLIEVVFSWGGIGQYAVQAVGNADFAATQGVVLFAALFSLLVYLFVDLVHAALDPRVRH